MPQFQTPQMFVAWDDSIGLCFQGRVKNAVVIRTGFTGAGNVNIQDLYGIYQSVSWSPLTRVGHSQLVSIRKPWKML